MSLALGQSSCPWGKVDGRTGLVCAYLQAHLLHRWLWRCWYRRVPCLRLGGESGRDVFNFVINLPLLTQRIQTL